MKLEKCFRGSCYKYSPESITDFLRVSTLEDSLRHVWYNVRPGDVVFDIGASVGSWTLPALAVGATVYSFEPDPNTYRKLIANINLNPGPSKRANVYPYAIGDRNGPSTSYTSSGGLHNIKGNTSWFRKIDTIVSSPTFGVSKVDWIKIDVEGYELAVLRGAINTIRSFRPKMIVESHLARDANMNSEIKQFIASLGLRYRSVDTIQNAVASTVHTLFF